MRATGGAAALGALVVACQGPATTTGSETVPDPTCGDAGRQVVPVGVAGSEDRGVAALRQDDGTTVLFGAVDDPTPADSVQTAFWATVRLTADCGVDAGYGTGGITAFTVADPDDQVEELAVVVPDAAGGAVLWGSSVQTDAQEVQRWAVTSARVDAEGLRDAAFGAPSTPLTPPASVDPAHVTVRAVTGGPDPRVLVEAGGAEAAFALVETDGAGALVGDPQWFDREGVGPYTANRVDGAVVRADGSARISGVFVEHDAAPPQVPGVLALAADGARDAGFGVDGVGGAGLAGDVESVTAVAELPDGALLLAGVVNVPGRYEGVGVVKLSPAGIVDVSFGDHGIAAVDLGVGVLPGEANPHVLRAFRVADDGTMLLAADVFALDAAPDDPAARWHAGLVRLLPDGTPDPTFAEGGVFEGVGRSPGIETLADVHQDPAGVVTAFGTTDVGGGDLDWVVYRFAPR